MKKIITKSLSIIFLIGIVSTIIMNVLFQMWSKQGEFKENAIDNFWQIKNIIQNNEADLKVIKDEFADKCIVMARTAAYIAQNYPEMIEDVEESKNVAALLQVDELHFFNTDGVIYAGTNPEYYGYSFSMGGQIGYFAPMLNDYTLELCQDITANTAEGKMMQYAAVWSEDRSVIVQVGLKPARVLEAIEGKSTSDIFSMISSDTSSEFYAVDIKSNEILGSTSENQVGLTAEQAGINISQVTDEPSYGNITIDGKKYYYAACLSDDIKIIKICSESELYKAIPHNTIFICACFTLLFGIFVLASYMFLDRKITKSILRVNEKLKDIEHGNWETVLRESSSPEFEQLSRYINSMVESLIDFPKMMSKALEFSEVPIAICEYVPEADRFTTTNRVKDILLLTDEEYNVILNNPKNFEYMLNKICTEDKCYDNDIYCIKNGEQKYIRVETFTYKKSRITILIDMTREIVEKEKIAEERDTDILTGLYNGRAFYRQVDKFFAESDGSQRAALVLIDLDNLKKINDEYGHVAGNKYLMAMSEVLHLYNGNGRIAARMGGDEFILFMYNMEIDEVNNLMNELISQRDHKSVKVENEIMVKLEFSAGCAHYPSEAKDFNKLIKMADARMYQDKEQRKKVI